MRLVDADALYNGAMKDEYFDYVEHDNHGRESFAYSCAMQRLAEAPTIPAIPVEWLHKKLEQMIDAAQNTPEQAIAYVLWMWKKEQEER